MHRFWQFLLITLLAIAPSVSVAQIATIPDDTIYGGDVFAEAVSWELEPDSLLSEFHQLSKKGAGLRIAILDTGYDPNHPATKGAKIEAPKSFIPGQSVVDRNGHGQFILHQLFRLLPEAVFIPVKVLSNGGAGSSDGILRGFQHAEANDALFYNGSFGSSSPHEGTRRWMLGVEGLPFVAGGNSGGTMGFPARHGLPACVPIGASDKNGRRASFSSIGEPLMGIAPGVRIIAARAQTQGLTEMSGSSMGCPSALGFVAAVWVAYGGHETKKDCLHCMDALFKSVTVDIEQPGRDRNTGWGNVTLEATVKFLRTLEKRPPDDDCECEHCRPGEKPEPKPEPTPVPVFDSAVGFLVLDGKNHIVGDGGELVTVRSRPMTQEEAQSANVQKLKERHVQIAN